MTGPFSSPTIVSVDSLGSVKCVFFIVMREKNKPDIQLCQGKQNTCKNIIWYNYFVYVDIQHIQKEGLAKSAPLPPLAFSEIYLKFLKKL